MILPCGLGAPRKEVKGLREVADGEVRLAGAVLGLALELSIATLGRDREGAPSDLDGLKVLAGDVPEPRADIGKDSSQASRIAEPGRQAFGLAHDSQRVVVSPEWYEREPQLEAYVDGHWQTFDARNNVPRIGRILIARGRDATDVAISNAFGPNTLVGFTVWADEVKERHTS